MANAARARAEPTTGPSTPAARAFLAAAGARARELAEAMRGALRGRDPERVHALRTTIRRVRSLLRAFDEEAPKEARRALDDALDRLAEVAGSLRDLDVLLGAVASSKAAAAHPDGAAALSDVVRARRRAPRERLRAALRSAAARRLPGTLRALAARAVRSASPWLAIAGASRLPATFEPVLARVARLRGRLATAAEATLHPLRIDTKKARYAAEAYADAFGRPLARFAKDAAALQDALGAIQDARVHLEAVASCRAALDPSEPRAADAEAFVAAFRTEREALAAKARGRLGRRFEAAFGAGALRRVADHLWKRASAVVP
jgi:CHAD domain-containing protein